MLVIGGHSAEARIATLPTTEQRQMFGQALQRACTDLGLSQRGLAAMVDVSQASVSQWLLGRASPRPERVAALERALRLEPSSLARLLGYVPYSERGHKPVMSVIEAAEADPRLGEREQRILVAVYRELIRQSRLPREHEVPAS